MGYDNSMVHIMFISYIFMIKTTILFMLINHVLVWRRNIIRDVGARSVIDNFFKYYHRNNFKDEMYYNFKYFWVNPPSKQTQNKMIFYMFHRDNLCIILTFTIILLKYELWIYILQWNDDVLVLKHKQEAVFDYYNI